MRSLEIPPRNPSPPGGWAGTAQVLMCPASVRGRTPRLSALPVPCTDVDLQGDRLERVGCPGRGDPVEDSLPLVVDIVNSEAGNTSSRPTSAALVPDGGIDRWVREDDLHDVAPAGPDGGR